MTHRKILAIRNDRMGDLLMTLPALHLIRRAFPQAHITILVQEGVDSLMAGHPDVDLIMTLPATTRQGWRDIFRLGSRLRRERFDATIVFNPSKIFHCATWLAGIPTRIGYRRKWGFLLTRSLTDTKATRDLHEIDYNLELIRLLGILEPHEIPPIQLPDRPETQEQLRAVLEAKKIFFTARPIAIHPWTSHPVKAWPLDSFAEVARRLGESEAVVLIGGPENKATMEGWMRQLPSHVVDLVGEVPLKILPALLRNCRCLLSNDSGPVHVAAAVGTPTLVVAPRSHEAALKRWRPLGKKHRILLSPTVEEVISALQGDFRCAS